MGVTVRKTTGDAAGFRELPADGISEALGGDHLVWVDALSPDEDEIALLGRELALPPLVLEDIGQRNHTPVIRRYGDDQFIVFYVFNGTDGAIRKASVSIYVTKRSVLTLRWDELTTQAGFIERWRQDVRDLGSDSPITLVYSLLDAMTDSYFPMLDDIADRVEAIEDRILNGAERAVQREIVELRRTLLTTRRILAAERESLMKLFRSDHPRLDATVAPYFQDVYDHVNRAAETLDSSREMLASTMDSYLSQVNNELNVVVRRLTAWTIILTTLTVITGVYGMNFVHMPELAWRFGYLYAVILMVVLSIGMWSWFRRARWV